MAMTNVQASTEVRASKKVILLVQEAFQVHANLLLHHAPITTLLRTGVFEGACNHPASVLKKRSTIARYEASAHNLGKPFAPARVLIDRDDRQYKAVFRQMAAITDDDVFNHVVKRAGIDADPADGNALTPAGAESVDLKRVAGFENKCVFESSKSEVLCERSVPRQLAILAMNGNEVSGANQVEN